MKGINCELLRVLAAQAWTEGNMNRAAELAAMIDRIMLETMEPDVPQAGERRVRTAE